MYAYKGSLYCDSCGKEIADEIRPLIDLEQDLVDLYELGDSDTFPQYADESQNDTDCPFHCEDCGELIAAPLTIHGDKYVAESLFNLDGDIDILNEWFDEFAPIADLKLLLEKQILTATRRAENGDSLHIVAGFCADLVNDVLDDIVDREGNTFTIDNDYKAIIETPTKKFSIRFEF